MCDPVTATLVLTAATAGVSAYGSYQQGQAQENAARYQAAVSENNAKLSEQYAQDAERRAAAEQAEHRRKVLAVKGDQLAAMAANGFDVGQGSALDILGDTAAAGELDALRIQDAGEREANKFRQDAQNFRTDSAFSSMQASAAGSQKYLDAGSSLLSGAAKFSNQWATLK